MKTVDISIIILSYNTKELVKNCLYSIVEGIVEGKKFLNTEVIVVDNNSSDGSAELIKSIAPDLEKKAKNQNLKIKIIENKENLGFSKGNNVGLREAKGEYLLFLNSDTEVFPGSLVKAWEFMKKHPEVGSLTPKTLLITGKMDPDCHRGFPTPWASLSYFLGLEKLFPKSKIFGQYHKFYLNLEENHEIDAGAGAFMMVPRKIVEKVGGWDENYFFYGEDLDFYYRINQAGYKVIFFATPLLYHYKGASSGLRKESKKIAQNDKKNKIRVARASIEAMEIFYKKFYANIYPHWLTFLVLAAIKLKGLIRIMKYRLS